MKANIKHHILKQHTTKEKGFLLYNGPNIHGNGEIIAVGVPRSKNIKTGDIMQVYILDIDKHKSNQCLDCKHLINKTCYVVPMSSASIIRSFKKGNYTDISNTIFQDLHGFIVRYGADGDIAALPVYVSNKLKSLTSHNVTMNYSHQWQKRHDLKGWTMASVDNTSEMDKAHSLGFKTFRATLDLSTKRKDEILCPNMFDKSVNCQQCQLCDGSKVNILVLAHGAWNKQVHFYKSFQ